MNDGMCSIDGCDKPAWARTWCQTHYQRWRTLGSPTAPPPPRRRPAPKVQPSCSIDGCDRPQRARGWCARHYAIWRLHGDPLGGQYIKGPAIDRFLRNLPDLPGDVCWPWGGSVMSNGYGQMRGDAGEHLMAHRFAYEHLVGPIPEGLQLDHVCHTDDLDCDDGDGCPHRRCVNPAHLEPVTPAENARRRRQWQLRKTSCPQGHPYDEVNTHFDRHGYRHCRMCNNIRTQKANRKPG